MEGFLFDVDALRAEKYIGDGLRLSVVFLPTELAFHHELFMVDRSRCLQPQIERNGIVSLLRQQSGEKQRTNGALDEEKRGNKYGASRIMGSLLGS